MEVHHPLKLNNLPNNFFPEFYIKLKINLEKILALRANVKESRQALSKALNQDTDVIQNALTDNRKLQLECQGYDAICCKVELKEDICVLRKRLNHVMHQAWDFSSKLKEFLNLKIKIEEK